MKFKIDSALMSEINMFSPITEKIPNQDPFSKNNNFVMIDENLNTTNSNDLSKSNVFSPDFKSEIFDMTYKH